MIRSSAIILLTLTAILASIPSLPVHSNVQTFPSNYHQAAAQDPPPPALAAFNYTYSQANLYTEFSSPPPRVVPPSNPTNTSFVWQNTVTQTSTNATIAGSGFNFSLTGKVVPGREVVNWTLTIPKPDCQGCTSVGVDFDLSGVLTKGSNASYIMALELPNSTTPFPPPQSGTFTTPGSFPATSTTGCGEIFCIDASNYIGYHLNLTFAFAWNSSSGPGMFASVGEISVASIGSFISSATHVMQQDSNPSLIDHTATLTPINYNNTLSVRMHPSNTTAVLKWQILGISIYYPSGYTIKTVSLNSTEIYPAYTPNSKEVALETVNCVPGTNCAQALVDLNMTDFGPTQPLNVHGSTITIISTTPNSIRSVSTLAGGVAATQFTSGDTIGVNVVVKPSIANASSTLQMGTVTITFPPALLIAQFTSSSTAIGGNYTFTLPSSCGTNNSLCDTPWTVNAVFNSGFDLGNSSATFSINLLQVSLTGTGGTNSLSIQGTLKYGNGNPAANLNATLFAIDTGTPVNTPASNNQTNPSPSHLNISNVTLVNGVFTQGQPLIMLFTVVNPSNSTQAYNATITIQHEWPGPQSHNMSVTFSLGPGDQLSDLPFNSTSPQTYEASIMFAAAGVQVTLYNLRTFPNSIPRTMSSGTSPVLPNAPHAGLFNITLTGLLKNGTREAPSSILSPTYAYVLSSFTPSRYLYASPVFTTGSNGAFSETINSAALLGAKNLTVFVLARDAFGVVVMNTLPNSIFSESTYLIPTTDSIGPVGKGQSVTATLHLQSNSTLSNGITEAITVNLILQGNGLTPQTLASKTVTIGPGQTQAIQLSFTAPSNVGSYTLTFSSPQDGGVLTSQTLQVTILQGYVQLLIPAGIGIGAAIIILGVYLIRERRVEEEEVESTKPKGSSEKTKPVPGAKAPSKSLTQTPNMRL